MPSHVNSENDLQHLLDSLLEPPRVTRIRNEADIETTRSCYTVEAPEVPSEEQFTQVGAKVKIKWDESELVDQYWVEAWLNYCCCKSVLS